ncbi:hypothetical protein MKA57_13015 [[Clostridium] innocuum]|nr:hypothetical protein [[Clostridium] innocuum]
MDIVVTQIKQIGREIMLDGNSLVGYQHSANLFIKLIKDTSETNPFKGMVLSGYCTSWKSDMPIVCPLQEKDDGTYILLPDGVFENEGDVYLSLAAIDENKIVITSNRLALQVDASNKIVSSTNPSEKYWEIEVLNAMKAWYANVVDPVFIASNEKLNQLIRRTEEHEEKAEELQQNAQTQQNQVAAAIGDAEQATQAANTAAANADEKATAANTAAQAANKAKDDADTATGKANKAASDANTAASNANTKAGEAATATTAATQAADSANTKVQEIQQKLNNGDFNGRTTYNGNGDPAISLGKDGDTYLNKSNEGLHPKWLYLKENGKWTPLWNTQGIDGTDTVPVGAGYLVSGDTVPPGYKETTPPFSNPNLLINGDFQVWQKGNEFNITSNRMYTADRWIAYMNASDGYVPYTITNSSRRMKISSTAGECKFLIFQHVELNNSIIRKILGKKLTLSVKIISSNAQEVSTSATILYNSSDKPSVSLARKTHTISANKYTIMKMTFDVSDDADFDDVKSLQIIISSTGISSAVYIDYAKLELGEIATPYMPRPYAEELMLCKRYGRYIYVDYTINAASNSFSNMMSVPIDMRIAPTLTLSVGGTMSNLTGERITYSAFTDHILFSFTASAAGMIRVYGRKYWADAEIY